MRLDQCRSRVRVNGRRSRRRERSGVDVASLGAGSVLAAADGRALDPVSTGAEEVRLPSASPTRNAATRSAAPHEASEQPSLARPQLLFFYSPTSGSSRRAEGFLAQVLQRRRNHESFVVHRVDVKDRPDLAERFRIENVPTLIVVDGRRVRARLSAPRGCAEISRTLAPWLK
jgi:hypothetical protein